MKHLILFLCLLASCILNAQNQNVDGSTLMSDAQTATTEINKIRNSFDSVLYQQLVAEISKTKEIQNTIDKQNRSNDQNIKALQEAVTALSKNIDSLHIQNLLEKKKEIEVIELKYEFAKSALTDMSNNTKLINFFHNLNSIEAHIETLSDVWSDTTFRNVYDEIEDWGTIAGMALSVAALSGENNEVSATMAYSGLALATISKLIGRIWGAENGNKFSDMVAFMELTKGAYEKLSIRNSILASSIEFNNNFQKQLNSITNAFIASKDTLAYIASVKSCFTAYNEVLSEIPDYIDEIHSINAYLISESGTLNNKEINAAFKKINEDLEALEKDYNDTILSILIVSPEIIKVLEL
jgi:hemoglobin-like flavoprotein